MAKMRKKKNRTMMVSFSIGAADITAATTILSPSTLFTKRRGRKTRKALNAPIDVPSPPTISKYAVHTQMKSS